MSGEELHVDTADLRLKAIQISQLHLIKSILGGTDPQPPDALTLSKAAVDNLRKNIAFMVQNQVCGSQEGDRLAESLNSVAQVYDDVDAAAKASFDGVGPPPEPKMPAGNKIPAPTPPAAMGAPGAVTPDEVGDVEKTQQLLSNGDHGGSLRSAAKEWADNGTMLRTSSEKFKVRIQNWEGEAADEAYAKLVKFGEWLSDLGDAWHKLAGEAFRISDAHVKALGDHTPVYQQYEQLKSQMIAAIQSGGSAAHNLGVQMEQLHRKSEAIVHGYAGEAAPHSVTPTKALPATGVPTVPATPGRSQATAPTGAGGGAADGGTAGGGGGTPSAPASPQTSPMSADRVSSGTPSGDGSGSGGGSPAGGGSPSGGGSPIGSPSGLPGGKPTGVPTLPDAPGLHPAAADAGGAGGASGGGAGGGIGATPLQPSVAGKSVGPGAAGGAGAGTAPAGAGSSGAAMGGGMGGAPMGGHGQNHGGKEKRRTPGLSPDEELYVEDREHTEEVIGARKRRTLQDPKDPQ